MPPDFGSQPFALFITASKPTVLITGATGQISGDTLRCLRAGDSVIFVAAVRLAAKA